MHQAQEDLLVLAAQNGNQKAFAMIYQLYQKALLRYSFKLCNDQQIAQDAVQEVWLKLASNIRKLKDPRTLRSWLYRLARWRTLDLLRQANRLQEGIEEFDDEHHSKLNEENIHEAEDLKVAIKYLPPIENQIIHLFYLDELKIDEIAVVLDIPSGTVKSRLNRARKLLKQKFN